MNTLRNIPFHRPYHSPTEAERVSQALEDSHLSGCGPFTKKVEKQLEEWLEAPRVLMTTSCTHALELAALLLDIQPGDEVIAPTFTFVSTVNAFVLRGARPVLIDIRPDTLNLDEKLLERSITPRTKAIIPVHYAGVSCEMDTICQVAGSIPIVEDAAHSIFGTYQGRLMGSFGSLSAYSFHATKNFSCGEGGALQINDPELVERAEIIREKGTDRRRFQRGEIDKYTWRDLGSSYVISDLLSALLYSQLESRDAIFAGRQRVWQRYQRELGSWAASQDVELQKPVEGDVNNYHLFYLLLPMAEAATRMLTESRLAKVGVSSHYQPLHLSGMAHKFGYGPGDCPVADSIWERLIRLPLYPQLEEAAQDRVLEFVTQFQP